MPHFHYSLSLEPNSFKSSKIKALVLTMGHEQLHKKPYKARIPYDMPVDKCKDTKLGI